MVFKPHNPPPAEPSSLNAARRNQFVKLAEGLRAQQVNGANNALRTNFTNPEDFLPRITELICSKGKNARNYGEHILNDVAASNPDAFAKHLPRLLPILKEDRKFDEYDPYDSIVSAIIEVAKHNVLKLPPPKELQDAIFLTWDRTLRYGDNLKLTADERKTFEELEKSSPYLLCSFMETIYPASAEMNFTEISFREYVAFRVGRAGLDEDSVKRLVAIGPDVFRKAYAEYWRLRYASQPFEVGNKAVSALIDAHIALLKDERHRGKALERLSGLVETRPLILRKYAFTIMGYAAESTDSNYLLICKIIRKTLDGGESISRDYSHLLLKGIGKRSQAAQKEGRELARRIARG